MGLEGVPYYCRVFTPIPFRSIAHKSVCFFLPLSLSRSLARLFMENRYVLAGDDYLIVGSALAHTQHTGPSDAQPEIDEYRARAPYPIRDPRLVPPETKTIESVYSIS